MVSDDAVALTRYCKTRAGDALRAVFTYSEESGELVYAKPEMRAAYREGRGFESLCNAAWAVQSTIQEHEPANRTLGQYRVTVHTFEEAFVMQFRGGRGKGIAVFFDQEIGQNLHEFLMSCERQISKA